mmetsp:Transcript_60774/g.162496  ORF Transcript_60774/g.162496 Transcript_60774/m.162496 type:complete len:82 (-) Transcript_60774:321-566(-)
MPGRGLASVAGQMDSFGSDVRVGFGGLGLVVVIKISCSVLRILFQNVARPPSTRGGPAASEYSSDFGILKRFGHRAQHNGV